MIGYITAYLRLSLLPGGILESTLECPIYKLVAQSSQLFSLENDVELFYERLYSFFTYPEVGTKLDEETQTEVEYQHKIARKILKIGFPENVLDGLKALCKAVKRKKLALGIIADDIKINSLPWEVLGSQEISNLLNLNTNLIVFRFIESKEAGHDIKQDSKRIINVLLASSAPLAGDRPPNIKKEFDKIEELLSNQNNTKTIVCYRRSELGYIEFAEVLNDVKPQVLHMSQHGTPKGITFDFMDEEQVIPYESILGDIIQFQTLKTVILNVCYSARSLNDLKSSSFTRRLVENGIPSAIGMATVITARASLIFNERLYLELSFGKSILEAYDRAIDTLRNQNDFEKLFWSVPMLYQDSKIIPFPIVSDEQALWPAEYIEEALILFKEFEEAIGEFSMATKSDIEDWEDETIDLRFILPSLYETINTLRESLPKTTNPTLMNKIFTLRDLHDKALGCVKNIGTCVDNLVSQLPVKEKVRYTTILLENSKKMIRCFNKINEEIH